MEELWTDGSYAAEEVLEPSASHLEKCDADFVQTTRVVAKQLVARGDFKKAEAMLRTSMEAQERVYGREDANFMRAMYELSFVLTNTDRHEEARVLLQDLVASRSKVLGQNHPHTLNAIGALADTWRVLGPVDEAERFFEKTLTHFDEECGPDDYRTLIMRNNLALLLDSDGRCKQAETIFQRCISGLEAQCHPHDKNLLVIKSNFGKNQDSLEHQDVAERMWRECLDGMTVIYGTSHPITMDVMAHLATLYENDERFDEALPILQQLRDLHSDMDGEMDKATLRAQLDLAQVYCYLEDPRATEEAETVVAAWINLLDRNVSNASSALKNVPDSERDAMMIDMLSAKKLLGRCYHFDGLYDEGAQIYLEILAPLADLKLNGHKVPQRLLPDTLRCLGELRSEQKMYTDAEWYLREAIRVNENEQPKFYEYAVMICKVSLGEVLADVGKSAESDLVLHDVVQSLGEEQNNIPRLQISDIAVKLGLYYEGADVWGNAYKMMEKALAIREGKLGDGHRSTLVPLQGLALSAEMLGEYEEALSWYEEAIVGMEKVYGFHFRDLHSVVSRWTGVCYRLGKEHLIPPRLEVYREHDEHFKLVGSDEEEEGKRSDSSEDTVDETSQRDDLASRRGRTGMADRYPIRSKHLRSKL
ncbi:MAG: hypothetical protein Q9160_008966 [Pyrenula sp. 1 TL-2023]